MGLIEYLQGCGHKEIIFNTYKKKDIQEVQDWLDRYGFHINPVPVFNNGAKHSYRVTFACTRGKDAYGLSVWAGYCNMPYIELAPKAGGRAGFIMVKWAGEPLCGDMLGALTGNYIPDVHSCRRGGYDA